MDRELRSREFCKKFIALRLGDEQNDTPGQRNQAPPGPEVFRSVPHEVTVYSLACHTHWHYLPANICLSNRTIRRNRRSTQPPQCG